MGKHLQPSTLQQLMIKIWEMTEDHGIGNIGGVLIFHDSMSIERLMEALEILILNNDCFHMSVKERNGQKQLFLNTKVKEPIVEDLSSYSRDELYHYLSYKMGEPLADGSLFDYFIFKDDRKHLCLFMKMHHLISDAWSFKLIAERLIDILLHPQHPRQDPSYQDYIEEEQRYLNSPAFLRDQDFWLRKFQGDEHHPSSPLIRSNLNNKPISYEAKRYTTQLASNDYHVLTHFYKTYGLSPLLLFQASFAIYLSKLHHQQEVILGSPFLNRLNQKQKQTIGLFINTLALRVRIKPEETFLKLCLRLRGENTIAFKHGRYPYLKLLENLKKNSNFFDVLISYQNARIEPSPIPIETRWIPSNKTEGGLSLSIADLDNQKTFSLHYDYQTSLYTEDEIKRLHDRLMHLLFSSLHEPNRLIKEIEIVTPSEKRELLSTYNRVEALPTFFERFLDQVQLHPNKTSIIFNERLTYKELYDRIVHRANQLKGRITLNKYIAIGLKNRLELLITELAVLSLGGSFIPLDQNLPSQEIKWQLTHAKADSLVVDNDALRNINTSVPMISIDDQVSTTSHSLDVKTTNPNACAYILFTSGTSGKPKGVQVSYKNLHAYINSFIETFKLGPMDKVISHSSITSDFFIEECFPILCCGGTLVLYDRKETVDVIELSNQIKEEKITLVSTTPYILSALNQLPQEFLDSVRLLISGGSVLKPSDIHRLIRNKEVYNTYGPTEATVIATFYPCQKEESSIPIGIPFPHAHIYLLQGETLVPPGAIGEIVIGGDGVSLGYCEDTKDKFIPSPFNRSETLYRTGDLGRWNEKGQLEFLGRLDNELKIRGHRISPLEIEKRVEDIDGVIRAYVVSSKKDHLLLYYRGEVENSTLRKRCRDILPVYLIPHDFIHLEDFPYTKNGKIDHKRLPEPKRENNAMIIPTTTKEELLYQSMCRILGRKDFGVTDNLFDYGLDSLGVIMVQSELYELNLPIGAFYAMPTIRELATYNTSFEEVKSKSIKPAVKTKGLSNVKPMKHLLLTGASGFLGSHLLYSLIKYTDVTVYCLTRSVTRLLENLNHYFGSFIDEYPTRILFIQGDIEGEGLGLSQSDDHLLKDKVDTVIHCGALTTHVGKWEDYEKTNVIGTKNILHFCQETQTTLHFMSTLGVDHPKLTKSISGYLYSKRLAEGLINEAINDGLNAWIYRLGNLTWSLSGTHPLNHFDNGFYRRLSALLKLKGIPQDYACLPIEMSPIDVVCTIILNLLDTPNRDRCIELPHPRPILLKELMIILNPTTEVLSMDEFRRRLFKKRLDPDVALLLFYLKQFEDVLLNDLRPFNTRSASLHHLWKDLDEDYIKLYKKVNRWD